VLLLWCTAVLDMRQPTQLLQKLLQQLHGASELPTHALAQLVQVHMWLEVSLVCCRQVTFDAAQVSRHCWFKARLFDAQLEHNLPLAHTVTS
jgi:hypothetical protein